MSKTKKKHGSIFAVFFVIILLLSVVFTIGVTLTFSGDRVPMIGKYYLYMHESSDMEPDVPDHSLVLARAAEQTSLHPGSKVLCYKSDGNMALRVIYDIQVNEDGSTSYYPGTALEQGSELAIERGNIFAECLWASRELYTVVKFAGTVTGLMCMLVVPCIILIIMLLVKIAKSSREEVDEEDFLFDEEEMEEMMPRKKHSQPPLFNPEQDISSDASLEKKKASIQENFSEKPVNEDSPYQKAVQERTMKFKKIEQEDIERAKREQQERAAKAAAIADASMGITPPQPPVPEEPVVLAEPEPEVNAHTGYVPTHSSDVPIVPSDEVSEPKRSDTPNIDDILDPGELRAAKSGQRYNRDISSTDSIDDLIAALENEKKKL